MANFIITEEQYNKLLEQETDTLSLANNPASQNGQTVVKVTNSTGDPGMAVNNTAKKLGNPKNVKYEVSGTQDSTNSNGNNPGTSTSVLESRIITKKELTENRFKHLRQNSKLYTVKDFLRK